MERGRALILEHGLGRFVSILACFMMIVAAFSLRLPGSVVCAAGEVNLKLSKIEDVEGWLSCELANLDCVDVINVELCNDIYIGYDVFDPKDGIMNFGGDYIFDFTDPRFRGKTVNINGNGRKITNCERDLLFLRAGDCVVNLNDLKLKSRHGLIGKSSCIYLSAPSKGQESVLNVNGSTIIEDFCSFGAGAIFAEGSALINLNDNSVIRGCGAQSYFGTVKDETGGEGGGAICAKGTATINMNGDSSIVSCRSDGNGGAISIDSGTVNMNDRSVIRGCGASRSGGAIYGKKIVVNANSDGQIVGCESANCGGWAIYIEDGMAILNGNFRIVGSELSCAEAIFVDVGMVRLNANSSVSGCRTISNGAICVLYGLVEMNGSSKISQCRGGEAGAIYVRSGRVEMNENSEISECEAEYGGAIDVLKGTVNMNGNSKISECEAREGGAIDVLNGDVTMNANSSIVSCRAEGAGAIYCGNRGTLTLKGGRIEDCCGPSRLASPVNFGSCCDGGVIKIANVTAKTFKISASGDVDGFCPDSRGYKGIFSNIRAEVEDISPHKVVFRVDGVMPKPLDRVEVVCVGDALSVPRFEGYNLVELKGGGSKIVVDNGKIIVNDDMAKIADKDNAIILILWYEKAA